MKYNSEDKLKPIPTILYGLQWWVVTIPTIITMGVILGKIHFGVDTVAQTFYMQKLFFVLGITLLVQILFGHRLPIVAGPASVLLIGILASMPASVPAIYTAIAIGGLFITLISSFGLLKYLQKIFTARVIIVILLLIPLTLGPTIIKLVFVNDSPVIFNLIFVFLMCIFLLFSNKILKGIWKSTTLIFGIIIGTIVYYIFFGNTGLTPTSENTIISDENFLFIIPEFDIGIILSFLFCAIALIINEVSSIEAVGQMLESKDMEKRTKRGVGVTGIFNLFSGFLGVIGPIDYSSSPGIIASTGCASRFPFIPTAILLIICAFIPPLVSLLLTIPNIVMGTILLYVMTSQFAAGFQMTVTNKAVSNFNEGVTIGLSLMIAMLISFMPAEFSAQIPSIIRPILSNGFVMGIITMLFLEHIVYRKKENKNS